MRMMRYSYIVTYVHGKELFAADALSRSPLQSTVPSAESRELVEEIDAFVRQLTANVPIKPASLELLRNSQKADQLCCQLQKFYTKR